ncbi:MAG: hypothetical protein AB8B50_10695 [Pirellulaceae bacterium]
MKWTASRQESKSLFPTSMLFVVACILQAGCSPPANSVDVTVLRDSILVANEPQGLISLAQSYESVDAENAASNATTIVGRIYASGMSPFEAESASFSVIELPKPGHNHDDPGDCPFCKRELENAATAVVQVVDAEGEPIAISAQELLGLERNDDIVATGTVEMVGDLMIVNATQIHILAEDAAAELASTFAAAPSTGDDDQESTVAPPPLLPPQAPDPLLEVNQSAEAGDATAKGDGV